MRTSENQQVPYLPLAQKDSPQQNKYRLPHP